MNDAKQKHRTQLAILIVLIVLGGASIWYWGSPSSAFFTAQDASKEQAATSGLPEAMVLRRSTQDQLIRRYVTAYQTGNCAEVAKCTLWVQDRVRLINAESDDPEVREHSRSALCEQLFSREEGQDRISILGVDDRYLIPATVRFTIEGADSGRPDLDVPVLERVWGIFTYSDPGTAPKDENGDSIHSLRAGLNISMNNLVLKGSVRGNWEIDFNSISLQW